MWIRSGFEPKVCVHGSDIPAPDWSIFDLTKYNENIHINKSRQALPVMAQEVAHLSATFVLHILHGQRRSDIETP